MGYKLWVLSFWYSFFFLFQRKKKVFLDPSLSPRAAMLAAVEQTAALLSAGHKFSHKTSIFACLRF